jgi:protein-tyrosine phosphatase
MKNTFFISVSICFIILTSCGTPSGQKETSTSIAPFAYHDSADLKLRLITMEGPQNFRDLGGYLNMDQKMMKRGLIFRSDKLSTLTDNDKETLRSLGIRTVIDLRTQREVEQEPYELPQGIKRIHMPMWMEEWQSFAQLMQPNLTDAQKDSVYRVIQDMLTQSYVAFPTAFQKEAAQFLEVLKDTTQYPMVIHCTAGTDRTGFLSALVLKALHVHDSIILDDYALSAALRLQATEKDTRILHTIEKWNEMGGIQTYMHQLSPTQKTYDILQHYLLE